MDIIQKLKKTITSVAFFLLCLTAAYGQSDSMKIRFLGTGAADWHGPDKNGEQRRLSSILVDDAVLVDFTPSDMDMLPPECKPRVIFYTHSHGDHYNTDAALKIGIDTVYCSNSWVERCERDFARTSERLGVVPPTVIGLEQQQEVTVSGVTFKALPANHYTGDLHEQALIYLLIKGNTRVLYATDTGGICANAAIGGRFGADGMPKSKRLMLSGVIMEATVGVNGEENFRLFSHSCVETVLHTARVLRNTGVFPKDRPVYLTHMARTLHPGQAELDRTLAEPLKAAYDGLEVIFTP